MTSRVKSPVRWDDVDIGDTVELRRNGDVVWVTAPAGGRRLFHIADGFDLAGVPA
jgi:hypothetical protein